MRGDRGTFRTVAVFGLVLLLAGITVAEQPYNYYRFRSNNIVPLPYGPAAFPGATSALWTNPAGTGADGSSGFLFNKPSSADGYSDFLSNDLAWGINLGGLGFGVEYVNGGQGARRYTVALADEVVEGMYIGSAYHWSEGMNLQNSWDLGLMVRPTKWLSVGGTAVDLIGGDRGAPGMAKQDVDPTYNAGLALRPFGPMLTLTGDVTFSKIGVDGSSVDYVEDLDPTFTASVMPLDGLTLRGGYAIDSETVFGGISFSFGMSEIGGWSGFANDAPAGTPNDAGATWIRTSSHWQPSLIDYFRPKKVVKMKLSGRLVEEPEPFSFFRDSNPTMLKQLARLERIAEDDDVSGLWLDVTGLSAQLADLQELRAAIQTIRDSGKKVFVYGDDFGFGQYYLASAADEIYMLPTGMVAIPGIGYESLHLNRLFEKIHVDAQVEKVGRYKSAGEMFTEDSASVYAEEAMNAILDDWFDEWLDAVADGRNAARGDVEMWVNEALHNGNKAAERGLVDGVAYDDEIDEIAKDFFGDKVQMVGSGSYFGMQEAEQEWEDMTSPKIAVIFAEGMILPGHSGRMGWSFDPYIGAETLAKLIRQARTDRRVKAIVMRVDSPGGSGMASDIIAREVRLTTNPVDEDQEAKPFIVSMSGVAASGGYFISTYADTIVAPTTSVTGSIGVLGVNLGYHGLLDTLGIHYDPNYRGENAGIFNGRRWNEEQQGIVRGEIEAHYQEFISRVAEGRGMELDAVDEVAQGRVWSGDDALGINLVDANGGFQEALRIAKERIGKGPDDEVDLKLYTSLPDWALDYELSAFAFNMMPEAVQELLVREEALRALDKTSLNMLAPVDAEQLVIE